VRAWRHAIHQPFRHSRSTFGASSVMHLSWPLSRSLTAGPRCTCACGSISCHLDARSL
jgi:hypothetical protein